MAGGVLDVDGLKAALVLLPVLDDTDPASVPTASDHNDVPDVELDEVYNLVGLEVKLDGVVRLDERVRVADGAPIIGVEVGNTLLPKLHGADLAELELHRIIKGDMVCFKDQSTLKIF